MRKRVFVILSVLLLAGCSSVNNTATDDQSVVQEVSENTENENQKADLEIYIPEQDENGHYLLDVKEVFNKYYYSEKYGSIRVVIEEFRDESNNIIIIYDPEELESMEEYEYRGNEFFGKAVSIKTEMGLGGSVKRYLFNYLGESYTSYVFGSKNYAMFNRDNSSSGREYPDWYYETYNYVNDYGFSEGIKWLDETMEQIKDDIKPYYDQQ